MTTTSTLAEKAAPTTANSIRALLMGFWRSTLKPHAGAQPRHERRYKMRYDDLVGHPMHDEIRRAWWL